MKFTFDSDVFAKEGISTLQFSVLLYYMYGGTGELNEEICDKLWNMGYLIKALDGYEFNVNKMDVIEVLLAQSETDLIKVDRTDFLADKLRDLFPEGKKAGTPYYWRDSKKIIANKLKIFFKKYGNEYSDTQILKATEEYIKSFNGNYTYMQLLKYFISKRDLTTGEERSELLSYLENEGQSFYSNDSGELC